MFKSDERFPLGRVSVDSGQLVLVDPAYLRNWNDGEFDLEKRPGNDYAECCLASLSAKGGGQVFNGLAVCFSTGWGDGSYPVFATKRDGRIVKVEIDLDADEREEGEGDAEGCPPME